VTAPIPATTAPMADAAKHIRDLATYFDGRLTGPLLVRTFDTGVQTANGDGSITAGNIPGLATISGAVYGPAYVYQDQSSVLWVPLPVRDPNTAASFWCRCFNPPTNTVNVGKKQRVIGVAWGPATRAESKPGPPEPEPRGAPGGSFPRGTTPKGLRYPGTDEPQYRTAAAIGDLADDVGVQLGGMPTGLHLAFRSNVFATDSIGFCSVDMKPELSQVRGAVATAWDTTGGYPQSRLLAWEERAYAGGPNNGVAGFYVHSNAANGAAPDNYPARLRNNGVGATIMAWGDP